MDGTRKKTKILLPSAMMAVVGMLLGAAVGPAPITGALLGAEAPSDAEDGRGCSREATLEGPGLVHTNVDARLQEALCGYFADPWAIDGMLVATTEDALVAYASSFGLGYTISIGPAALGPVTVQTHAAKAAAVGLNDAGDALCAEMSLEVELRAGPAAGPQPDPDASTLYPDYFVDIGGALGISFPQSLSLEVTGTAPSAAHMGGFPAVQCLVSVEVPFSHLVTTGIERFTAKLTARVAGTVEVTLGHCDGHEGSADCNLDHTVGLGQGDLPTLTVFGASEELNITPIGTYSWKNLDPQDEDKARVIIQVDGEEHAAKSAEYTGAGSIRGPASPIPDGSSATFCLAMRVRDVDQWWDLNGGQGTADASACLSIEYHKAAAVDASLGLCQELAEQTLERMGAPTADAVRRCLGQEGVRIDRDDLQVWDGSSMHVLPHGGLLPTA